MKDEGYNQMMRALNFWGPDKKRTISMRTLESVFRQMRKDEDRSNTKNKKPHLTEAEYEMISFRFGFDDGKVKWLSDGAYKYSYTIEKYKEKEKEIVLKVIKYIDMEHIVK